MSKLKSSRNKHSWINRLPFYALGLGVIVSIFLMPVIIRLRMNSKLPYTQATIKTNKGDFTLTFRSETPKTVANFIQLAKSDYYSGTRIHRVVNDLLIQGGDPFSRDLTKTELWGKGGPGYIFDDELEPADEMKAGSVAMVNNGPDTNGSQFFILVSDASWLAGKHTLFATVTSGLDVVKAISILPSGLTGIPREEVVIQNITLVP